MTLTLTIPEKTAKALEALALITGHDAVEIATIELEGTFSLPARNPHELLGLALDVYCDDPASRAEAADRFQWYCRYNGIDLPEPEVRAALAEANGDGRFGELRILNNPEPPLAVAG